MTVTSQHDAAARYLRALCVDLPSRRVGSAGNRAATALFAREVAAHGWQVETQAFTCIDWEQQGAELSVDGSPYTVFPSPYSLGCDVRAPLAVVERVEALESAALAGKVVLLRGEIASEQLMPKSFPFYNPEHHQRIVAALEAARPQAIVAATSRDVQMVGGQYPFPLIEDGDFDIPSVYMTEEEGARLAARAGETVTLRSRATRIPAAGDNVVARKGRGPRRVVLFAHIDARIGSPGAGDNASGVVALLLLAGLLADYAGPLLIELVAMNGEDYYACPGELLVMDANEGRWDEVVLGINLDDIGYYKGRVAYSLYDCPPALEQTIRGCLSPYVELMEGDAWYQGDHGLFLLSERPAVAFTSELVGELMAEITHTPNDRAEWVDPRKLAVVAEAVRSLLLALAQ